jgi:hypothetical protein
MKFEIAKRWWLLGVIALTALVAPFILVEPAEANNPPEVHFFGVIQEMPSSGFVGNWKVRGGFIPQTTVLNTVTVHVTATTVIDQAFGEAKAGAYVQVIGRPRADGSINADKIKVLPNPSTGVPVKFFGVVEKLPASGLIGDWIVRVGPTEPVTPTHSAAITRTVTVHVSAATEIDQSAGEAKVGAFVKIEGLALPDRTVNAREIQVMTPPPPPVGRPIEFFGKIDRLPTSGLIGDWVVSSRTVHVSAATRIIHPELARVGAFVKVHGTVLADGTVNAQEIEVRNVAPPPPIKYIKFYGIVQELPSTTGWIGDWKINGLTVHVTSTTIIRQTSGAPAVGKPVEVKGILQNDGTVNAIVLETKPGNVTASPFGRADAIAVSTK